MDWLNYHHLLYFWAVAKHGTIVKAADELRLAQPTISGQIRALEDALGERLFKRTGRNLVLTEAGQVVFRYADEIFSLGRELTDTLRGRPTGRPMRLTVGVSDVLPKLVVHRLLEPALRLKPAVQVVCREDKTDRLLSELSTQAFDLVLADTPVSGMIKVRAFNHLLGECGVSFVAAPKLADKFQANFPASLEGAPMLLPTENTLVRRSLDQWFDENSLRPQVVAEFEDSALLKVFGRNGEGIFAAPTAIEKEICNEYNLTVVGRTNDIRERFYAITVERRIKHPAVQAISDSARNKLFKVAG